MDYEKYVEFGQQVAKKDEAGDYPGALAILRTLLTSDISEADKSLMYYNAGLINEKMGEEQNAFLNYERGMSYEQRHGRILNAEAKAGYLHRLGRLAEARRAYEELLARPSLMESDKLRIRNSFEALREQA